jgi:hypothetical protein
VPPVAGAEIYQAACLAENAALRGETAAARRSFETMLAARGLPAANARLADDVAGRARGARRARRRADAAYRNVLELGPDTYAAIAYADKGLAKAAGADTEPSPKTGFVHRRNSVAARDPRPFLDAAGRRGTRRRIGMAERPRWRGSRRSRCRSSSAASRASVRERSRPEMSGLNRVLLSTSGSSARSSNRS